MNDDIEQAFDQLFEKGDMAIVDSSFHKRYNVHNKHFGIVLRTAYTFID